ncbi:hypothetical protein D3C80_1973110 [compost metagenome]
MVYPELLRSGERPAHFQGSAFHYGDAAALPVPLARSGLDVSCGHRYSYAAPDDGAQDDQTFEPQADEGGFL